jgi:formiminotetrahydrofolate cyclodeaminase
VSAWAGAFAAALVEMSAAFAPGEDLGTLAARARASRERLVALAEAELTAYAPVLEALRLPASDPSRDERRRAAVSAAAETPLEIARASAEIAALAVEVSTAGSRHLVGDALAAAELAQASCRAAARLVEINLQDAAASTGSDEDPRMEEVRELTRRMRELT